MIEVGEYVRTEKGVIDKVYKKEICHTGDLLYYCKTDDFWFFEITKHSKNLIDLIEVGDFVNGFEVHSKTSEKVLANYIIYNELFGRGEKLTIDKDNIKTILTHEQYEANCFKVGE